MGRRALGLLLVSGRCSVPAEVEERVSCRFIAIPDWWKKRNEYPSLDTSRRQKVRPPAILDSSLVRTTQDRDWNCTVTLRSFWMFASWFLFRTSNRSRGRGTEHVLKTPWTSLRSGIDLFLEIIFCTSMLNLLNSCECMTPNFHQSTYFVVPDLRTIFGITFACLYIICIFFPRSAAAQIVFLDQARKRTTVGRTPLDEWSARHRDLYLTTHNTHNKQRSMARRDSNPQFQQTSDRRSTP
jgi:hypothetical protein